MLAGIELSFQFVSVFLFTLLITSMPCWDVEDFLFCVSQLSTRRPCHQFPKAFAKYYHLFKELCPGCKHPVSFKPAALNISLLEREARLLFSAASTEYGRMTNWAPDSEMARRAEHHSCPGSKVSPQETSFAPSNFSTNMKGKAGGRNMSVDCWGLAAWWMVVAAAVLLRSQRRMLHMCTLPLRAAERRCVDGRGAAASPVEVLKASGWVPWGGTAAPQSAILVTYGPATCPTPEQPGLIPPCLSSGGRLLVIKLWWLKNTDKHLEATALLFAI